jgi:S1-C subfamily serine protease
MNIYLLIQGNRPAWADTLNSNPVFVFIIILVIIIALYYLSKNFSNYNEEIGIDKGNEIQNDNDLKPDEKDKFKKKKVKAKTEKKSTEQKNKVFPSKDLSKIKWNANGSGFFISRDGYIATNFHVVSSDEYSINNIAVEFNYKNEIRIFNARIIRSDDINDLAIIKIEDENFNPLRSIPYSVRNDDADLGEEVFALGYPMALTLMGTDIKFTDGRISSKTGFKGNVATYQSTTPIQPGNSGGPLFDFNGNLLGINSSGLSKKIVDNVSYTIKTSYLKNLVNVLPKKIVFKKQNTLDKLSIPEKIKVLSKVVVLIKVELK